MAAPPSSVASIVTVPDSSGSLLSCSLMYRRSASDRDSSEWPVICGWPDPLVWAATPHRPSTRGATEVDSVLIVAPVALLVVVTVAETEATLKVPVPAVRSVSTRRLSAMAAESLVGEAAFSAVSSPPTVAVVPRPAMPAVPFRSTSTVVPSRIVKRRSAPGSRPCVVNPTPLLISVSSVADVTGSTCAEELIATPPVMLKSSAALTVAEASAWMFSGRSAGSRPAESNSTVSLKLAEKGTVHSNASATGSQVSAKLA